MQKYFETKIQISIEDEIKLIIPKNAKEIKKIFCANTYLMEMVRNNLKA